MRVRKNTHTGRHARAPQAGHRRAFPSPATTPKSSSLSRFRLVGGGKNANLTRIPCVSATTAADSRIMILVVIMYLIQILAVANLHKNVRTHNSTDKVTYVFGQDYVSADSFWGCKGSDSTPHIASRHLEPRLLSLQSCLRARRGSSVMVTRIMLCSPTAFCRR